MEKKGENKLRDVLKAIDPRPRIINNQASWEGDANLRDDAYTKIHVDEKVLNDGHILLEKLRS